MNIDMWFIHDDTKQWIWPIKKKQWWLCISERHDKKIGYLHLLIQMLFRISKVVLSCSFQIVALYINVCIGKFLMFLQPCVGTLPLGVLISIRWCSCLQLELINVICRRGVTHKIMTFNSQVINLIMSRWHANCQFSELVWEPPF